MIRKDLLEALDKVQPGVDMQEVIEQSSSIVFDDDHLYSYNDEISISAPLDCEGIKGAVQATELIKLVKKMSDKKVSIAIKEDQLIIRGRKTKAGLNLIVDIQLPNISGEIVGDGDWQALPEDFKRGIYFCLLSATTDVGKGVLTCLKVEGDIVISCDNLRLTRYEMAGKIEGGPMLLPAAAAKHLIKHDLVSFIQDESWLHFRDTGDLIFSCRTMAEEYPDVENLFEVEGKELEIPKGLKEALGRAEILATDWQSALSSMRQKRVNVVIDKGKIVCRGESDVGWVEETDKIDYDGSKIEFATDPTMLAQILDKTTKTVIGESRLLFIGDKFDHVIAVLGE